MELVLLKELISRESVTPNDNGCMEIIEKKLANLDFIFEHLDFEDTKNLWARLGNKKPVICFAGHTDVVPTGDISLWKYNPFKPTIIDNRLYGRGSADMKSGLAASIIATYNFLSKNKKFNGSIAFLITSDEEGIGTNGTKKVVDVLKKRSELIDYTIVAEPSSNKVLGDMIKNGRRGSLSGKLTINGVQGHIAYPHLAKNPIHLSLSALLELTNYKWDNGDEYFAPTSFQISNIHAGTGANNVIPQSIILDFNLRFSPVHNKESLVLLIENILSKHNLDYHIDWHLSGNPFLTKKGYLTEVVSNSIKDICGIIPRLDTAGGTSDGRFLVDISKELVEFGLKNDTIHKINECIDISDLRKLTLIYEQILNKILT